jgi:alpha-L-rhamnosidase
MSDFRPAHVEHFGWRATIAGCLLCATACTSPSPAAGTSAAGGMADGGSGPVAGSTATGGTNGDNGGSEATSTSGSDSGGTAAGETASGADAGSTSVPDAGSTPAPTGLLCELTSHPERALITDATPEFSWIVNAAHSDEHQTAYRIRLASSQQKLAAGTGDVWDSGKIASPASVNVAYAGPALKPNTTYFWQIQSWDSTDTASDWSASQQFMMAATLGQYSTPTPTVVQTPVTPATTVAVGTGHYFFDFGRAAFGWVELTLDAPADGALINVNIGEKSSGQGVDLNPGATIRSAHVQLTLQKGTHTYRVATPKDATNTSAPAIPLPAALGVVMPFRYVEVSNSPVVLTADSARQIAVSYPFDDTLAAFSSSNDTLNQVWGIAKYSIKATTFAGIYIDGDRERTPYEADAYIQQLGHYAIDRDYALARHSHEYLMVNPTWPTEWKFHSIMLAWNDWMYTGNTESLAQEYALLKKEKTLEAYINSDGLLNTASLRDIVDWPEGERDGYVLTGVNTVVNSFWCHILGLMADMATELGNTSDATRYRGMQATAIAALNAKLFNSATGLFMDGQTTTHSSLHANMFPLAFGLVPASHAASVLAFVKSRGMACSVYGAEYLLEALYQQADPDAALALLTSTTDRSFMNMIQVGSTITLEAWDVKYKPNLDWNHAWGAAPANILPRYVLGVRPLTPGFAQAVIAPQPGSLTHIEGTVATIRGPVRVVVDTQPLTLSLTIPANMTANVAVPPSATACTPLLDGQSAQVTVTTGVSWLNGVGSGQHVIVCQ